MPAVASLGTRPAVESGGRLLLEVHVFDFAASVYGALGGIFIGRMLRTLLSMRRPPEARPAVARSAAWG